MLTSRERVELALNHQEADRVPLDLGGCSVTGMHVSSVYLLRQALQLDLPGTPVKVIDPFQMLGEIKLDLLDALGGDVVAIESPITLFGYKREGWKEWELFDGTPVLVPAGFNTEPAPNGGIFQYPEGDGSCSPSGYMPKDGFYFDVVVRQHPIEEDKLNPEDNLEDFKPISDEILEFYRSEVDHLYNQTDKAILAQFGGSDFGNIALVPGPWLKDPKGIRALEEWYISPLTRPDYVMQVFDRQCELALANLKKIHDVVGDRITAIMVTGTDFGAQKGPLISPKIYRQVFFPFHKRMNDWIHANTKWRTFVHSCGSIARFIPSLIEAGFEILNPVQTAAAGMDPRQLKTQFGDKSSFWGGGVDTQRTLPFGTPDEVCEEVRQRLRIFGKGGGYVFNPVHNVQAGIAVENLLALYEAYRKYSEYPLN